MPRSTGEDWMGTPQACKYLGIEPRTLYRLIDQGEIRAYKMGRGSGSAGLTSMRTSTPM